MTTTLPRYVTVDEVAIRPGPGWMRYYVYDATIDCHGLDEFLHYGSYEQCEHWLEAHGYQWVEGSDEEGYGWYERIEA
jgi:hypothetical protein